MDEPLSNLDAKLRVGMRASLAQLHARLGVTTRLRHPRPDRGDDARPAGRGDARRADRAGRRAADALRRAARPLRGRLHRLAGDEPRRGDDRRATRSRFGQFRVPLDPSGGRARDVERVVLGIRPEAFEDAALAPAACRGSRSRSSVLEELGADAHVFFRVDAPRVAVETRGHRRRRRGLLPDETALFTARVDPRTGAARPRAAASSRSTRRASTSSTPDRGQPARAATVEHAQRTRARVGGRRSVLDHEDGRDEPARPDEAERDPRARARPDRAARRRRRDPVRAAARAPTSASRGSPSGRRSTSSSARACSSAAAGSGTFVERAEDRPGADDDLVHARTCGAAGWCPAAGRSSSRVVPAARISAGCSTSRRRSRSSSSSASGSPTARRWRSRRSTSASRSSPGSPRRTSSSSSFYELLEDRYGDRDRRAARRRSSRRSRTRRSPSRARRAAALAGVPVRAHDPHRERRDRRVRALDLPRRPLPARHRAGRPRRPRRRR